MSKARERIESIDNYLAIAGRIERLQASDPDATLFTGGDLGLWQRTYAEEIGAVIARRDRLVNSRLSPAVGGEEVRGWISFAEEVLKHVPKNW